MFFLLGQDAHLCTHMGILDGGEPQEGGHRGGKTSGQTLSSGGEASLTGEQSTGKGGATRSPSPCPG